MDTGKKVVIEYYYWDVPTNKENYVLQCKYERILENPLEIGQLNICCERVSASCLLQKNCRKDEVQGYVDYVVSYINNFP